jgi:hypothetical protein
MGEDANPKAFIADVQAALAEVAVPQGDPMQFYVAQVRAAANDVDSVHANVVLGKGKPEDLRRWLVRTAAYALRAWIYSHQWVVREWRNDDLLSSDQALAVIREITGIAYTPQFLSLMVSSGELKVVQKRRLRKTGRPSNFFKKDAVYEVANRKAAKQRKVAR